MPIIGCVPEEVAPPEEKVIKIGSLEDLAGPYSTIGVPISNGYSDFWKYVNKDLGGINGIRVLPLWIDDRSNPSLSISGYRRLKDSGVVFLCTTTTPQLLAIQNFLIDDRIASCGISCSWPAISPKGAGMYYNCLTGTTGRSIATGLDWYYKNEWPKKGLDRPMRVGIITWDNPLGHDAADGPKRWIKLNEPSVKLVGECVVSPMLMDYTTEIIVLKGKDIDVHVGAVSGAAYALIPRDAVKVGLSEEVPIILEPQGGFTPGCIALAGESYNRILVTSTFYSTDEADDIPALAKVREVEMRYRQGKYWEGAVYGYFVGEQRGRIAYEAIKKALEQVGFENLTGMAVKEGLDSLRNIESDIGSPISYGDYPGDRTAQDLARAWHWDVKAKRPIILSDWFEMIPLEKLGYEVRPGFGLSQ
mgnify:CR=1 FL=1